MAGFCLCWDPGSNLLNFIIHYCAFKVVAINPSYMDSALKNLVMALAVLIAAYGFIIFSGPCDQVVWRSRGAGPFVITKLKFEAL